MDAIITAAGRNSRMIADFRKKNKKPLAKPDWICYDT